MIIVWLNMKLTLLETLTFADSIYTERYMGLPTDEGNTYEVSGTYTVSSWLTQRTASDMYLQRGSKWSAAIAKKNVPGTHIWILQLPSVHTNWLLGCSKQHYRVLSCGRHSHSKVEDNQWKYQSILLRLCLHAYSPGRFVIVQIGCTAFLVLLLSVLSTSWSLLEESWPLLNKVSSHPLIS